MFDSIINMLILAVCVYAARQDKLIKDYVRKEYEESKDLNRKLDKVYKSKKKKTTLVKALINTPVETTTNV